MKFKKINILVSIFILVYLINSCVTPPATVKSCLNLQISDLKIKWGDYIMKKDILVFGYIVHSNGDIYKLNKIQDTIGIKIGNIEDEEYCNIQKTIRNEFLKVEILNVTADTMRFIEYQSNKSNLTQRAFWNSKYRTGTNGGFFDVFDKLNLQIKTED